MPRNEENERLRKRIAKECQSMKSFVTVRPKILKIDENPEEKKEETPVAEALIEGETPTEGPEHEQSSNFKDLTCGLGENRVFKVLLVLEFTFKFLPDRHQVIFRST